jgi:hypothetical protein
VIARERVAELVGQVEFDHLAHEVISLLEVTTFRFFDLASWMVSCCGRDGPGAAAAAVWS